LFSEYGEIRQVNISLRAFYSLHCNEIVIASEAKQSPEIATSLRSSQWPLGSFKVNYFMLLVIIEDKGFVFVEMSNPSEAETAKEALDGTDYKVLTLKVDEAHPSRKRQRRDYRRY